jgi:hypothetical protein
VRTVASNYGIGGYIFRKDGDKELPIRFISKSLHKSQLSWSMIEKEAFAIFYAVAKYDFLLRDFLDCSKLRSRYSNQIFPLVRAHPAQSRSGTSTKLESLDSTSHGGKQVESKTTTAGLEDNFSFSLMCTCALHTW